MRSKLFTVILPCLNEEATILKRVESIKKSLEKGKYKNNYEILVCDNNSTDRSHTIYKKNKINYIVEKKHGYGSVLRAGIMAAKTKYVVMLDGDLSYKSDDIPRFVDELEAGNDLVMGNRFHGKIEKGAMPLSHKIGSRFLTGYANLFFRTKMHDFHCGLRAFVCEKMQEIDLSSSGFEFASEMIIKAKKYKLKLKEIPTDLSKDGRKKKSHLRTFRDGFRHLHEINKIKFSTSRLFRYTTTFAAAILTIFIFTVASCLIPHNLVHDNAVKSVAELDDVFRDGHKRDANMLINRFEEHGDIRNYAMIYATDPSHPIKSAIEMNYNSICDTSRACRYVLDSDSGAIASYSRYWQGQSATIHFFTIFFSANTLTTISTIIFALLFVYTVFKLFKKDKLLSVIFVLSAIAVNMPFTTRSLQFIPIMYVMLIGTLLVLRMREKNSKNFDILFLLLGIATCYFDFLTAETLSITVPLFVYAYLEIKENKHVSMKKIIIYAILWFAGYAGAFLIKWGLVYLDQGEAGIKNMLFHMTSHRVKVNFFEASVHSIGANLSLLMPFYFITDGLLLLIFVSVICLIYNFTLQREYLPLLAICLIPFLRFSIISGHSYLLNYFTYRALFCFVMFLLLTIFKMIRKTLAK